MGFLLEIREKIIKFYDAHDSRIVPAFRFLVTLITLILLNGSIGYLGALKNPYFILLLSLVCAFLPGKFMLLVDTGFIFVHLFALSTELGLAMGIIIVVLYLLFLRFTPKAAYIILLAGVCAFLKIPYVIPIVIALNFGAVNVIPTCIGIFSFYMLNTISVYETTLTRQTATDNVHMFSYIYESILMNRAMLVVLIMTLVTMGVVYYVRTRAVAHAWNYAIIAGVTTQFLTLLISDVLLEGQLDLAGAVVGTALGALIGYLSGIFRFNLDYKRTEHLRFEDSEYYYYVTAIPKRVIARQEVKVTKFTNRKTKKDSLETREESEK